MAGACIPGVGCAWKGACMAGGMLGGGMAGVCVAGGMHGRGGGGHAWQGACVAGKTAIAAGGTHPTGMHSCFEI